MAASELLDSLLPFASDVFAAHSIVLFEAQDDASAKIRLAYGNDDIDRAAVLYPGRGLAGWILRNKSRLVVNSLQGSRGYLTYYREGALPAVRSFMGCFIPDMGVACIDSLEENAFPPEKQKLFAGLSRTLALACAACESQEEAGHMSALEEIQALRTHYAGWKGYIASLLGLFRRHGGFEFAAFASRADSRQYRLEHCVPDLPQDAGKLVFSVYSDIIGWTFRNDRPVFCEGDAGSPAVFLKTPFERHFPCYACLPVSLRSSGLCGVVFLGSSEPTAISRGLRSFLMLGAGELANTLEWLSSRCGRQER